MKIALIIVLIFVLGSLGLIFLTAPTQKFLLELEKGYAIEKLTYLPGGYEPIPESVYIDLGSGASESGLLEVKSVNGSYSLIFRQRKKEPEITLDDAQLIERYPKRSELTINGDKTAVYSSPTGEVDYLWFKGGKQYELVTNDPLVTMYEVERVMAGIVPLKIDVAKPAKDFIDSFRSAD